MNWIPGQARNDSELNMKLIIGLGNPGKEYEKTRHNIGFRVLDEMTEDFKFEKKFNAEIKKEPTFAKASAGKQIIFAKPQTFMNNSGIAVSAIAKFHKIKPENIIVIHDDMDLAFGKIKISFGSRSAGHNGVQSIIDSLGTNEFYRIRIGIGPRPEKIPADKYVLQKFSASEEKEMKKIFSEAIEKIEELI
jgi:PTH1 family peptidyl-tRNA hydrolase